jgi:pimeloyl-ACP methyl ester carboxylesterase
MTGILPDQPARLDRPGDHAIAYHAISGKSPGVVFCSGFRSDMTGTKAVALAEWAARSGQAFVRFDYFGHGQSTGKFADGTIGRWHEDALAVIDDLTSGPVILVGSSMGGWISLLAARARPERIAGLVLIAPAPDFTTAIEAQLTAEQRAALDRQGWFAEPSAYSAEPTIITRRFLEDGARHLLLDRPLPFAGPVRILQGMADPDVPWAHALRVAETIASPDLRLTLFKQGDHRLSGTGEIASLIAAVEELAALVGPGDFEGLDDGG